MTLTCIVVTPEETALEEQAEFVAMPLFDGEIGIAEIVADHLGEPNVVFYEEDLVVHRDPLLDVSRAANPCGRGTP